MGSAQAKACQSAEEPESEGYCESRGYTSSWYVMALLLSSRSDLASSLQVRPQQHPHSLARRASRAQQS